MKKSKEKDESRILEVDVVTKFIKCKVETCSDDVDIDDDNDVDEQDRFIGCK